MWLTDLFKIKEFKAQIQALQQENAALANKLNSLEGENYFSIQGKVSELNSCYDQCFQESQTLSAQIRERFEKTQELDKQITSSQRKLTRIKEMYNSIEAAIQNYMNIPLKYDSCRLDDKYLEECERITPSIRLTLHDMDIRELHQAYLDKEKLIADLYKEYALQFTSPSDKSIYELLVLSLTSEIQNILYSLKSNPISDFESIVKNVCQKHLRIAFEGNRELAGIFTKFIGELEYHFIDLVNAEVRYYEQKNPKC